MNITIKKTDVFKDKVEELILKYPAPSPNKVVLVDMFLRDLYNYAVGHTESYIPKRKELAAEHMTEIEKK